MWDVGVGMIPKNLGMLSQTARACGPLASCLSRSLRVIDSDGNPPGTYGFLLLINV